jgi:hypothetical protein
MTKLMMRLKSSVEFIPAAHIAESDEIIFGQNEFSRSKKHDRLDPSLFDRISGRFSNQSLSCFWTIWAGLDRMKSTRLPVFCLGSLIQVKRINSMTIREQSDPFSSPLASASFA